MSAEKAGDPGEHRRDDDRATDLAAEGASDRGPTPSRATDAPVTREFMEAHDFWNRMIQEAEEERRARPMADAVRARLAAQGLLSADAPHPP